MKPRPRPNSASAPVLGRFGGTPMAIGVSLLTPGASSNPFQATPPPLSMLPPSNPTSTPLLLQRISNSAGGSTELLPSGPTSAKLPPTAPPAPSKTVMSFLSPSPAGTSLLGQHLGGTPPLVGSSSSPLSHQPHTFSDQQQFPIVVRRKHEEKVANPERLNLDRRRLTMCPALEGEEKLKLLNYQNNCITKMGNFQGLPCLVFLDLYNNCITEISGLECVPSLRVLMLGKNKITSINQLQFVPKLDVLDLHNNLIQKIENLNHLQELRVLNLAGNKIVHVDGSNLSGMRSLAEINLRRNSIVHVHRLDSVPTLQRVFLSANQIFSFDIVDHVLAIPHLVELSLDGNPVSTAENYRAYVVQGAKMLRHVDMRRVSDEERRVAAQSEGPPAKPHTTASSCATIPHEDHPNAAAIAPPMLPPTQPLPSPPPAPPPILLPVPPLNLVEYDVGNQRLHVTGPNADSTLERMPLEAIHSVYFESIPCDRAAKVFGPKLQRFTGLKLYRFCNNGLHSMEQLSTLTTLPKVLHLEIVKNDIVTQMPTLLPMFCAQLFPGLLTLNGVSLQPLDVQRAKCCLLGLPRPQNSTLLFPPTSSYDPNIIRSADAQTHQILGHCVTVEKKVRSLEGAWPGLLQKLVVETVAKLKDPPKHDELYKLT